MPSCAPHDLPFVELAPGYTTHSVQWGDMVVIFDLLKAGQDVTSMLESLPNGRCQADHWGYLLEGCFEADYGTHKETVEAGQAYHLEPGHLITVLEDCAALQFTRSEAEQQILDSIVATSAARS